MLLIAGGSKDHNILRLIRAAQARNYPHRVIFTDAQPTPAVSWDLATSALRVNGEMFQPSGTGLFIRFDTFSGQENYAASTAFYETLKGWAQAYPAAGLLNRKNESREMSKPRALIWARECGFDIPQTLVTNEFNTLSKPHDYFIAKPVGGGEYTTSLTDKAAAAHPYIVQEKLDYPELRLFRAGNRYFAFRIVSKVLDYRTTTDFDMTEIDPPPALAASLKKLTDRLGLDYAAADFKTDPASGKYLFLEVNTMPMFTGYDNVARGRLSDAIFLRLAENILAGEHMMPAPPAPTVS